MHPDQSHSEHPSDPAAPPPPEPTGEPVAGRPNRAARRGKRAGTVPGSTAGHGGAPHARGAQGRRINPVRRSG